MIDFGPFAFASPPRTATTWALRVFEAAGLPRGFMAHVHTPFKKDEGPAHKLTIVRHPAEWLRSYWSAICGRPIDVGCVDVFCELYDQDLHVFLDNYIAQGKPLVGDMFLAYNATDYLSLEAMPGELFQFLGNLHGPDVEAVEDEKWIVPINTTQVPERIGRRAGRIARQEPWLSERLGLG